MFVIIDSKAKTSVIVTVKGSCAVDRELAGDFSSEVHVLDEMNTVWNVMLNQTNIRKNHNKFYLIQLLENDSQQNYWVWMRHGRIGYRGQSSLFCFESDLEEAKNVFCKKFKSKTGNEWCERLSFEPVLGKYSLVDIQHETVCITEKENVGSIQISKLDKKIQSLMAFIADVQKMEITASELNYDCLKSPLGESLGIMYNIPDSPFIAGKLTEQQIHQGYLYLKILKSSINANVFDSRYYSIVDKYYTCIPHNQGLRTLPLIKTQQDLDKELLLLETLKNIQNSLKINGENYESETKKSLVDRLYQGMHSDLRPLSRNGEKFEIISKYLYTTHGATHMYSMEIVDIYVVYKESEYRRFKKNIGNRMLLWHGSRINNFYDILSHGLRIAPFEIPNKGYMFGKGIYFADVATKSGNYCYPSNDKRGLLLLAEVECHSKIMLCASRCFSDDEVCIPLGPLEDCSSDGTKYTLLYNEYVVYDVAQVRSRFIVEVKFNM
ncbi:Poly(ADP-ribose) polymerase catalytic domain protein [Dictyocaulus viviparus]|uniref:Poly [ADP-ribose] polymerase n=1 Tax=Dictyocaulus viviparus TaxID=29172 RepID=A0A0D8XHA4_DICVI|nr:Poly(ADP-ribose) polymerase catalytic domain protein [Dictyocaulus viviparus]